MEVPLEAALAELPVAQEIKDGLITGAGKAGSLYRLVTSYENADWAAMNACAEELGIAANIISQKYFECCENVNNIWRTLTMPYHADEEEPEEVANIDGEMIRSVREQQKNARQKLEESQLSDEE